MLYFTADARDGGQAGTACNTCCCENIFLKVGETNLITINYAPWSVPIGGLGLVAGLEYEVDADFSACSTGSVAGFVPPSATFYNAETAVDTEVSGTIAPTPTTNTFTFRKVPLSGPENGSVTIDKNTGAWTYTPNAAFVGWDAFWYEVTDAQGRTIVRSVAIKVGTTQAAAGAEPAEYKRTAPWIAHTSIDTNTMLHTVRFALHMAQTCQPCDTYKLSLRQKARDCNGNVFDHFMCFNISCKDC